MAEYAFKMFNKDLTCTLGRGRFQYEPGVWIEEPAADCARNGFHCAKNPLDCLDYYNWDTSRCWIVEIGGDIDEDARDSKIACTRIRLAKELTLTGFVLQACRYMLAHPEMPDSHRVRREQGEAGHGRFVIVRGKHPQARGKHGDVIALLKEAEDSREVMELGTFIIGDPGFTPDTWYNVRGEAV
ncbi:MAG: hypothetical protein IJ860_07825 [Eubacterium sp.]|nr:hypothetical protein [Eubacterium sp.]